MTNIKCTHLRFVYKWASGHTFDMISSTLPFRGGPARRLENSPLETCTSMLKQQLEGLEKA